ncbi:MAG: head-tail connector protein [Mesorhizobium sp.]
MSFVSLNLAKAHMNIYDFNDDDLIQLYIDAAEAWLGNYIGKPFAEFDPTPTATDPETGDPLPLPADFNPLPPDLKLALLKLVAFYYEQREAVSFGVSMQLAPYGVTNAADSYRECFFGEEGPTDGE